MIKNGMRPIHPGEFLREDYLKPLGMSANQLALALRVPATRIGDILNERRGVSADTAIRLAAFFGGEPEYWLRLQADYDIKRTQAKIGPEVARFVVPLASAVG